MNVEICFSVIVIVIAVCIWVNSSCSCRISEIQKQCNSTSVLPTDPQHLNYGRMIHATLWFHVFFWYFMMFHDIVAGCFCHLGPFESLTLYDLCGLMPTLCKSEDPSLLDGAQVNRGDKFLSVISVHGETDIDWDSSIDTHISHIPSEHVIMIHNDANNFINSDSSWFSISVRTVSHLLWLLRLGFAYCSSIQYAPGFLAHGSKALWNCRLPMKYQPLPTPVFRCDTGVRSWYVEIWGSNGLKAFVIIICSSPFRLDSKPGFWITVPEELPLLPSVPRYVHLLRWRHYSHWCCGDQCLGMLTWYITRGEMMGGWTLI